MQFKSLDNRGDQRGASFSLPDDALEFLGQVGEVHFAEILPTAVRGNHYHTGRKEVMAVWFSDNWTFSWNCPPNPQTQIKEFTGQGAILIKIESHQAHAIQNTGREILRIIAFSDKKGDPDQPDTFKKVLLS